MDLILHHFRQILVHIPFEYEGICKNNPEPISNADGPIGNGSSEGDVRSYNCSGDFMWRDGTSGLKNLTCTSSGQWTGIAEKCLSMLIWEFL